MAVGSGDLLGYINGPTSNKIRRFKTLVNPSRRNRQDAKKKDCVGFL